MDFGYCQFCPRRSEPGLPGLPGTCRFGGSDTAPVLIVGKAATEHDVDNEALTGRQSAILWSTLKMVGLTRADCRILTVCRCTPAGSKGKSLSLAQIGSCWDDVNVAIKASRAKVVICLGGDAMRRVTGLSGIEDYRGFLFKAEHLRSQTVTLATQGAYKTSRKCKPCGGTGCPACREGYTYRKGDARVVRAKIEAEPVLPIMAQYVIGTFHPQAITEAGNKTMRAFVNDLGRAARALRGELDVRRYTYTEVPRIVVDDAVPGILSTDIENHMGLHGAITRIGMAGPKGVWSADWTQSVRDHSRYVLGDPTHLKVFHNLQHDIRHLEAEGVEVKGEVFDTMWGGMALEPDLKMGLRSMAPTWLDLEGCWKDESESRPAWYNAHDAGITYDLAGKLIARHKQIGSYGSLMKFIMPSLRVLMDMHRRGMKVDLAWLGDFSRRLQHRRHRLEQLWSHHSGYQTEVLSSPEATGSLLYYTMGLDMVRDPDNKFRPTTAEWAIKLLLQKYPQHRDLLRTILAYRKVTKLQTACAVALGPDGNVHPHFGPSWKDQADEGGDASRAKRKGTTSTLRLAVGADGGLNMQQMPHYARRAYVAPPGYSFIKADIDRAEPWVYAVRSGDTELIRELTSGDPYIRLAKKAGCSRDAGKILFLARTYGAGARKGKQILAKQGIMAEQSTVDAVFAAMATEYPKLEAYRSHIMQTATKVGRLYSGFGMMREFLGGDRDATEAADWEAQHHVAMILWSVLVPLHEMAKSLGGWLQMTVYDEVLLCVPTSAVSQASTNMLEILRTERPEIAPGFRPAVSEVLVGTNWRDMK